MCPQAAMSSGPDFGEIGLRLRLGLFHGFVSGQVLSSLLRLWYAPVRHVGSWNLLSAQQERRRRLESRHVRWVE
jgi:hypothetical protein